MASAALAQYRLLCGGRRLSLEQQQVLEKGRQFCPFESQNNIYSLYITTKWQLRTRKASNNGQVHLNPVTVAMAEEV